MSRRAFAVVVALVVLWDPTGTPTYAQQRNVTIDFEVGDYDTQRGDWPITAVNVSGDLTSGETFTVELRDGDGGVLWSGTEAYSPPQTTIPVATFVAVGDVEEAAIAQRTPSQQSPTTTEPESPTTTDPPPTTDPPSTTPPTIIDPGGPVFPPPDPGVPSDPADPVEPPDSDDTDDPEAEEDVIEPEDPDDPGTPPPEQPPGEPPSVAGDVVNRPDFPQSGNGFGGAGQLALSMVIAVVFVAILFRAPLPAATTVRWRK